MPKIFTVASGSKGNCTYIGASDGGILIDAGISCARLTKELEQNDIDINKIHGIFVTHEHTDHVQGIKVFASKFKLPVFMTSGTYNALGGETAFDGRVDCRILDGDVAFGGVNVSHFRTSHDCADSCGYVIDTGREKIAVCTDLGVISEDVHNALRGCRAVVLESNHDVNMLQHNPNYPLSLKRRILGEHGHLSNIDCAEEIYRLINEGAVHFILAHLSEQNNEKTIALGATRTRTLIEGMQADRDYTLTAASPSGNRIITV